jgi:hypothetical protein
LTGRLAALVVSVAVLGAATTACSQDHRSKERFCAALPTTPDLSTLLDDLDTAEPREVETRLEKGADRFRMLADAAPPAISDDVDRVADTVEDVLQVVEQHLDDPDGLRAALVRKKAALLAAGAPAQRVVDYAREECGVDLGP